MASFRPTITTTMPSDSAAVFQFPSQSHFILTTSGTYVKKQIRLYHALSGREVMSSRAVY